jgi:hypothetical protein
VGGELTRARADYMFAMGPQSALLTAVAAIILEVKKRCMLELQWGMTEEYYLKPYLLDGSPDGPTLAGRTCDGLYSSNIVYRICYAYSICP